MVGSLLGTAVGDALGLPYEGLSPRRARRLLGPPDRYRFVLGRGMVSDDTDHACLVAQALVRSGQDPVAFGRHLAWGLRWWILGLPAGVGLATLRAVGKLLLGFSYRSSGVDSAGNGPAMRSAVLGAAIDDSRHLSELVRISTRITHTDPRAEWAALAVALAAREARRGEIGASAFLAVLQHELGGEAAPFLIVAERAVTSAGRGETATDFCEREGLSGGVTGFALHTVPVALQVWLRHQRDLEAALAETISCGGDTDTVAAIVGGIVGSGVGAAGVPARLIEGLAEWPRSPAWIAGLGEAVARAATDPAVRAPEVAAAGVLLRNLVFLVVVLVHGFRRLLPPY